MSDWSASEIILYGKYSFRMTRRTRVGEDSSSEKEERQEDANFHVFDSADVAAHYAALEYLSPCERMLFDEFLKPGDEILDLGVGGGRTTPYLSRLASRYVGVDYAPKMVAACQQKFPQLEFLVADAANLERLNDQTFDSVVMAFNGIDALVPDESRRRCLREIHRVLKIGGIFIFSSHNPRSVFIRPAWNQEKIARIAKALVGENKWLFEPTRLVLLSLRIAAALLRSVLGFVFRFCYRVWHRAFWNGNGYLFDSSHGGMLIHYAVPEAVIAEAEQQGFEFLRCAGDDYPWRSWTYATDWYYYVFRKPETSSLAESRCE